MSSPYYWPHCLHTPPPPLNPPFQVLNHFTDFHEVWYKYCAPGQLSRYNPSVRVGRSGDRIRVGARFSAPVQTGMDPTEPPIQWVSGLFPGGKAAGVWP
jgi:hypothetical protein